MSKKEINKDRKEEVVEVSSLPIEIENGKTYAINQPKPNSYTHGFFKYPCKFIPELPRWFFKKYAKNNDTKILDPFSGSGTTLLEASLNKFNSYGTEVDNFAKLLTKVKTTPLKKEEIDFIKGWLDNLIEQYRDKYSDYNNPYIPSINNLYHWFPEEHVQKLGLIKSEIKKIDNSNIVNFLEICLASSIRKSSNADDVSPKPYVSSKIEKAAVDPFIVFPDITKRYLGPMREFGYYCQSYGIGNVDMLDGDALNLNTNLKFDLAMTSPPYINAFDYARTLRLENLWLNLDTEETIRDKKKDYVGTENVKAKEELNDLSILESSERLREVYADIEKIDIKRAIIVKKYFEDMRQNLVEVKDSLVSGGKYCIVVGNSTIRKVEVESRNIICDIALNLGFKLDDYFSYVIKNHYLRIPRGDRGGKINKDYVIVLEK